MGIRDVVAGTTPVTILKGATSSLTQASKRGVGSIWAHSIQLTKSHFIKNHAFVNARTDGRGAIEPRQMLIITYKKSKELHTSH